MPFDIAPLLDDRITVRRILNPFDPREVRAEYWEWANDRSLASYLEGEGEYVVSINGKIVDDDQSPLTYLSKGDCIVLCPIPQGGGGGKNILRLAAMLAVTYFTFGTGGLAGGSFLGLTGTAGALAAGAAWIGGAMLINALIPPPKPSVSGQEDLNQSATYGYDGPKNTATEGSPVPVCYGEFRMGGNVIGMYTENAADEKQYLYMLFNAGEGPVADITDIQINDQPLTDFKDVQIQTRRGLPTQSAIDWFSKTIRPRSFQRNLVADVTNVMTLSAGCEQFRIDFVFPRGMFELDPKSGQMQEWAVGFDIKYRKVGDASWIDLTSTTDTFREIVVHATTAAGTASSDLSNYGYTESMGTAFGQGSTYASDVITGVSYKNKSDNLPAPDWAVNQIKDKYDALIGQPASQWPGATFSGGGDGGGTLTINDVTEVVREENAVVGPYVVKGKSQATMRRSVYSPRLPYGVYEVQVTRRPEIGITTNENGNIFNRSYGANSTGASDSIITDINEIDYDGVTYPHTALLAVKILMNDQISSAPTITYVNKGKLIRVLTRNPNGSHNEVFVPSDNPAWVVLDMITNNRYAGGMPEDRIDLESFLDWANWCDSQALSFRGIYDTSSNVWDAAQHSCRVGHAQLVNVGTRYYVAIERPTNPVMMFGVGNIIKGSFKQQFLPLTERANEVEVSYFDRTDGYKQRMVKIIDETLLRQDVQPRTSQITLFGVVDKEMACKEGALLLNMNRYIRETVEFTAPTEAIGCRVGDVIYVQHDMLSWAVSGRLAAGSTATVLKLDRQVTIESGKNYKVIVHSDMKDVGTDTVASVTGNFVRVTGVPPSAKVTRLKVGSNSSGIQTVTTTGVYVDDPSIFSTGQTVTFVDTDVITEANVAAMTPGDYTTINLASALSFTPTQFANFYFGEIDKVKRPYRVKAIDLNQDMTRNVTAIEYKPEVYDLSQYSGLIASIKPQYPPTASEITHVQNLQAYENTFLQNGSVVSYASVYWRLPINGAYAGANVYLSRDGGVEQFYARVDNANGIDIPSLHKEEVLTIRVVAFDVDGKSAPERTAPSITIKIYGNLTIVPNSPTGAQLIWTGKDCHIWWRYNTETLSYEFGSDNPTGLDTGLGVVDPDFKDFEIKVFNYQADITKDTPRRVEYVREPRYTYWYDFNFEDGLARRLLFVITKRSVSGKTSAPLTLDAYNPPPAIVSWNTFPSFEDIKFNVTVEQVPDFQGIKVWASIIKGEVDAMQESAVMYRGPGPTLMVGKFPPQAVVFVRLAAFDTFGEDLLLPTNTFTVRTTVLDPNAIAEDILKDSQLIPELRERIKLITDPDTVFNSVNARIKAAEDRVHSLVDGVEVGFNQKITEVNNDMQSLTSIVTTLGARTDDAFAAIYNEQLVRTQENLAIAQDILAMGVRVGDNEANLLEEKLLRATADAVLAQTTSLLEAKIDENSAALIQERVARVSADEAFASQFDGIHVRLNAAEAAIQAEQLTRATATDSLAQQMYVLATKFQDTQAIVINQQTAMASATAALAQQITQLSTTLNGQTTSVQTLAQSVDGISGQYVVKIDNNGYVVGFGIATTTVGGTPTSEFIVRSDRFAVVMPSYPSIYPFTIGAVNGTPRVIINSAIIGDAAINSAMIGDAQISTAKIADLSVNTLKIGNNAVTVPLFAENVASTNLPLLNLSDTEGSYSTVCETSYATFEVAGYISINASYLMEVVGGGFAGTGARIQVVSDTGTTLTLVGDWSNSISNFGTSTVTTGVLLPFAGNWKIRAKMRGDTGKVVKVTRGAITAVGAKR